MKELICPNCGCVESYADNIISAKCKTCGILMNEFFDVNQNEIKKRLQYDNDAFTYNSKRALKIKEAAINMVNKIKFLDKNKIYYLICDMGVLSESTSKILNALGYNCISVKGGIKEYKKHYSDSNTNNIFFTTSALRDYHYTKQKNNAYYHIQAINLPFQNIEFYYIDKEI